MESPVKSLCAFCNHKDSRYTCPKCGFAYCDVECYRSEAHGVCSQQFYREWVFSELKNMKLNEDIKLKTLQMIKKSRELDAEEVDAFNESDEDEEDGDDFEARFAGIDITADELDDATVSMIMDRMTSDEKRQFEQMVDSGEIMNLLPKHEFWKPWWSDYVPKLVEEVEASRPRKLQTIPEIPKDITLISSLTSKPPSPHLRHSIVNAIFSYCYVCRYFNGDHRKNSKEAIEELSSISTAVSSKPAHFEDSRIAIQSAVQVLINEKRVPVSFITELLNDTKKIISNKDISLRHLSDLLSLIENAVSKSKANKSARKAERMEFKLLQKKVEFYLSWINAFGQELAQSCTDVDLELLSQRGHEKISGDAVVVKSKLVKEKKTKTNLPLIEEMS